MPYGYATPAASSKESQNYEDIKHKVESWFDIVRNMAKDEGIADIKTEIFIDVKLIIESIIDYATRKNIDLIVRVTHEPRVGRYYALLLLNII